MGNSLGIIGLKVQNFNILSQTEQENIKVMIAQIAREHPEIFYSPTPRPRITVKFTYHGEPGGSVYAGTENLQNVCKTEIDDDGTPYFKIVMGLGQRESLLIFLAHEFGHAILTNRLAGSPFESLMVDNGTDMIPKYAMAYMQETFAWHYAYKRVTDIQYLRNEYTQNAQYLQLGCRSYINMGVGLLDNVTTLERLQHMLYVACDFAALSHRLEIWTTDNYVIKGTNLNLLTFIQTLETYLTSNASIMPTVNDLSSILSVLINWASSR